MAELWPECVCVSSHSLCISLSPAACCKRACGMWHLWHTYKSNCHLARGTRNRLRCVSRMCPSDAVATVTAIKHQIMHAHSTSSSSCNVAHEASLRAPPLPYSLPLFPFPLPLIMRFSLKRRMQKKIHFLPLKFMAGWGEKCAKMQCVCMCVPVQICKMHNGWLCVCACV